MMNDSVLRYVSSRWMDSNESTISSCLVYDPVQVEVSIENPMRRQIVTSLVKVTIYKDNAFFPDDKVREETRVMTLAPLSDRTISISFKPTQESGYHYTVHIEGQKIYDQPKKFPPRIYASRRATSLILNEPGNSILSSPPLTLTGRLVSTDTGEGIDDAKIHIFDVRHTRRDNLMTSVTTEIDGTFAIENLTRRFHRWSKNFGIYVKFDGDDVYKPCVTNQYSVDLTSTPSVETALIPQRLSDHTKSSSQ